MKLAFPVMPKFAARVKTELYEEAGENKAKVHTRLYGCFTTVGFMPLSSVLGKQRSLYFREFEALSSQHPVLKKSKSNYK